MSDVILVSNPRALCAVRNAINERAASIGASEGQRRGAVAAAYRMMKLGHSAAWAVSEACRALRGAKPAPHAGVPTPPGAA